MLNSAGLRLLYSVVYTNIIYHHTGDEMATSESTSCDIYQAIFLLAPAFPSRANFSFRRRMLNTPFPVLMEKMQN